MIEIAIAFACGAIAVKAYPPLDALAARARDWLYSLFRKSDDDDSSGPFSYA